MLATLAGLLLFLWALAAAVCALYTPAAFRLLGIDPLALEVVTGKLGAAGLTRYERFGLMFSEREIHHFTDVARAVAFTRVGLGVLLVLLVLLLLLRPDLRFAATTGALALFGFAAAAILLGHNFIGYAALSDFLHGFVFDPGSHIFSARSLTGHLYGNGDMIAGACFVIALAALALILAWGAARLAFPWPVLEGGPKPASGAARKHGSRR